MNLKKRLIGAAVASAVLGMCTAAIAGPTSITNLDLTNATPFGGFDWSGNGTAVSTPAPAYTDGDVITTYFFADAKSVDKTGGGVFTTPGLVVAAPGGAFAAGQYEYTIVATITEIIDCDGNFATSGAVVCGPIAQFYTTGGAFDVYYDFVGNATGNTVANQITGSGFTDGDLLLSGTLVPQFAGGFFATASGGIGSFTFNSLMSYTNPLYITPDQFGSNTSSTLQFGSSVTNWTAATSTPWGGLPTSAIQFQADSQTALTVPEPGVLALVGLGLLGVYGGSRRRAS